MKLHSSLFCTVCIDPSDDKIQKGFEAGLQDSVDISKMKYVGGEK